MSMYPLNKGYKEEILVFIEKLNKHPNITVKTNAMSTQIFGKYDEVMGLFNKELKTAFENQSETILVAKFFNGDLS